MFEPGTLINGRYETVSHLGAGGMGTVLKVIDRALDDETVALKFLFPHLVQDQVIFARFRNEVLVARKLAHPNIVSIYDFGQSDNGYCYISMEYVDGLNLRKRVHSRSLPKLTFNDVLKVLHQVAMGLAHAHERGVIHRDLKPDNILLSDDGDVKVMDFGLARSLLTEKGLTETGNAVGTPQYMAPEQIRGEPLDVRCDIYSLGILAYELVVGKPPFNKEDWFELAAQHMTEPIPPFASKEKGIPKWYEKLVFKSAEKERDFRYSSAEEFAAEIEKHLKDESSEISYTPSVLNVHSQQVKERRKDDARNFFAPLINVLGFTAVVAMVFVTFWASVSFVPFLNKEVSEFVTNFERSSKKDLSFIRESFSLSYIATEEDFWEAFKREDLMVIDVLLKTGTSPNLLDKKGDSALHNAIEMGSKKLIKALLSANADVDFLNQNGQSPLMKAASLKDFSVQNLVLNKARSINQSDLQGKTALMYAANFKKSKFVDELLKRGASVNIQDKKGHTALMYAVLNSDAEIAASLIEQNADVNLEDIFGNTALSYAVKQNDLLSARLLLDNSAKPDPARVHLKEENSEMLNLFETMAPEAVESDVEESLAGQAVIVVNSDPNVVFERLPKGVELQGVSVSVKNSGVKQAENIRVYARVQGAGRFQLDGPRQLKAEESYIYRKVINQIIFGASPVVSIEFTCSNCEQN